MKYFVILLVLIGFTGMILTPVSLAKGLPVMMDCKYDSDFIMSTNKLEFTRGETFVVNVKTIQNDAAFEVFVINPKGQEVYADVIYADKNGNAQSRFPIPVGAEKGIWTFFLTANPSYQQEAIFIGVDETAEPSLSIKPSSVNYKYKVDDVSFLIAGKPNTDVQVKILEPDDEKTHVYIVTLPMEGKCNFTLDLDGYATGVYNVEITDYVDDATAIFTIGMDPTVGEMAVNLFSRSYFFGDDVFVSIETAPEIDFTIEVMNPSGNVVNQIHATTEKDGTFDTTFGLPEYGDEGTWTITARSGTNFDTSEFTVIASVDPVPRSGGSVSADKTVYPTPWEDRPPLKQFKDGIDSKVIHCDDDLVLVQKYDGSPACVKPSSMWSLTERNWMELVTFETPSGFPRHEIENGQINSMKLVKDQGCFPYIIIEIDSRDSGNLEIFVSRNILDPKINGQDDLFLVLEDGIEVAYDEKNNSTKYRILNIPFEKGTKSVEIIATCLI